MQRNLVDSGTEADINARCFFKEIAELSEQILMYQAAKSHGYMESALFLEESNKANNRITQLKKEKKLLMGNDECEKTLKKTEMLISILKTLGPIGQMEEKTFNKIVSKIWIDKEKNLTYELINGLKLTVAYKEVT